ncbi:MAG: Spy/CpxP family protein refolding chaperone [Proteobacteria bacterium]|nr:Spy/CpxP family protein refolding chaperone [Pseudomonadota bacterium]
MKLKRTILISLLTALGIGGAAHAYDRWSGPPRGDAGWHHARWHGGGADGWCGGERDQRLGDLIAYAESQLKLTPDQAGAWAHLTAVLRDETASFAKACQDAGAAGNARVTADLARAETMMETGLRALQRLRPSVEALHAVLNEQQRATFDELVARRRL